MYYDKLSEAFVHPTRGTLAKKTVLDEIQVGLSKEPNCAKNRDIPLILGKLGVLGGPQHVPSKKRSIKILGWVLKQGISSETMSFYHGIEHTGYPTSCVMQELCLGLLFLLFEHHPQLISEFLSQKYGNPCGATCNSKARQLHKSVADLLLWFSSQHLISGSDFCAISRLESYRRLEMLGFDLCSKEFVAEAAMSGVRSIGIVCHMPKRTRLLYSEHFTPESSSRFPECEMMYVFDYITRRAFENGLTVASLLRGIRTYVDNRHVRSHVAVCLCRVQLLKVELPTLLNLPDLTALTVETKKRKCINCHLYDIAIGSRIRYNNNLSRHGTLFEILTSYLREKSFL